MSSKGAPLHFLSLAVSVPHPQKTWKHGEDSHFVRHSSLAVFDGVGGSASINSDPGMYSKNLSYLTSDYLVQFPHASIASAVTHAVASNSLSGSSTVCAASVNGQELSGINIGDSGLIVVRNGQLVFQTTDQMHAFNQPFQVSRKNFGDLHKAQRLSFKLMCEDVLVLGTDGVWDNMDRSKVADVVRKHRAMWAQTMPQSGNHEKMFCFEGHININQVYEQKSRYCNNLTRHRLAKLALDIASRTCRVAHSTLQSSPYARKARLYGLSESGGKLDDITIIVAVVTSSDERFRGYVEAECISCGSCGLKN